MYYEYARALSAVGRMDEAAHTLKAAEQPGLPSPAVRAHEAFLSAMQGDAHAARASLAQVPDAVTRKDPVLADVVTITRRLRESRPAR